MKKNLFTIFALLLVAATTLVAGMKTYPAQIPSTQYPATNAAFRDGMFQAKYDTEQGRKLHLSSGRWSSDADRASFIAGYHEALRQSRPQSLAKLSVTEVAAYRDGVNDGIQHRRTAQPFRADKTDNYRNADQTGRQAYATGYQLGYYAERDVASSPVLQAAVQMAQR